MKHRDTNVIDEAKMRRKLKTTHRKSANRHRRRWALRRSRHTQKQQFQMFSSSDATPMELREFMRKRRYNEAKQKENLELQKSSMSALSKPCRNRRKSKVCELDVSGKNSRRDAKRSLGCSGRQKRAAMWAAWTGWACLNGKAKLPNT